MGVWWCSGSTCCRGCCCQTCLVENQFGESSELQRGQSLGPSVAALYRCRVDSHVEWDCWLQPARSALAMSCLPATTAPNTAPMLHPDRGRLAFRPSLNIISCFHCLQLAEGQSNKCNLTLFLPLLLLSRWQVTGQSVVHI